MTTHFTNLYSVKSACAVMIGALTLAFPAMSQAQSSQILPLVSPMFSNNMVLQRDMQDPIWGWVGPAAKIDIDISGNGITKHITAVADSTGAWNAKLPKLKVGGPYEIRIDAGGGNTADLTNVLCGDVWLCSGQSNMQFGIGNDADGQNQIAAADYPNIRILLVRTSTSSTPAPTARTMGWDVCTPDTIKADGTWNGFSAVGYYFGKGLYKNLDIPIGLIGSYVGGTPIEAWTSIDMLTRDSPDVIATVPVKQATAKSDPRQSSQVPGVLFNSMISPLIPFGIKGALWYQGESNWHNGYEYRTLLADMIGDWRARWNEQNFPFLIVEIAGTKNPSADKPRDDGSANVRESEFFVSKTVPNTGVIDAMDLGDPGNIHPKAKTEVGRRLDLLAEGMVYHEMVDYMGPTYKSISIEGNKAIITFENTGGGLTDVTSDPLAGFAIAGTDQKYVWADAQITGPNQVTVSSPDVPQPVAVRYAWASWLALNLQSKDGLPAFPFRTDTWNVWKQP